jgi:hypothetical protein
MVIKGVVGWGCLVCRRLAGPEGGRRLVDGARLGGGLLGRRDDHAAGLAAARLHAAQQLLGLGAVAHLLAALSAAHLRSVESRATSQMIPLLVYKVEPGTLWPVYGVSSTIVTGVGTHLLALALVAEDLLVVVRLCLTQQPAGVAGAVGAALAAALAALQPAEPSRVQPWSASQNGALGSGGHARRQKHPTTAGMRSTGSGFSKQRAIAWGASCSF